jgi:hypothetical protein
VQALRDRGAGELRWLAAGLFLATSLAIPLLAFLGRPFAPRYVAMAAPAGVALVAVATRRWPPAWLGAGLGLLCLLSGFVLAPYYGGFVRSDYGSAMDTLRAQALPTDAIVLNGPWQDFLYRRYGWGLPPHHFVTSQVPTTAQEAIPRLELLAASHPRIWVVDSATDLTDPDGVVAAWLDRYAYPAPVITFQKALLRPYLTEATSTPGSPQALDATELEVRMTSVALDQWVLTRGDQSRLLVRAVSPPDGGARRMVARLVDGRGEAVWHWDASLSSADGGLRFAAALTVPPDAARGTYAIEAVVYEPEHPTGPPSVRRIAPPIVLGTVEVR